MAKPTSIRDLGTTANHAIYQQLVPVVTKTTYRNIFNVTDTNIAALAVAVSHFAASAGSTRRTGAAPHYAQQARRRRRRNAIN